MDLPHPDTPDARPGPSPERLSFKEKFAYALGDTACNFYFQFFNFFLVFYYTDIFGLGAAAVGTMMLVIRIFDAVMDPAMGLIADRTNTRWGKFRPYILWGAFPYGILGYAMFLNPSLSQHGKLVYAYLTYGLMWVAYTAINIPYSALLGVMTSSSKDRTSLSTFRFVCAISGGFLITRLVVPLTKFLGRGNDGEGIRYTMLLFSVVSVALFIFTFSQTRERVQPPPAQTGALRTDLLNLFRNRPWVVLFVAALLILASTAVRNGSMIYYFKYTARDEAKFSDYASFGTVAFILGVAFTPVALKMAERRTVLILAYGVNAILMTTFYFVSPASYSLLFALNLAANFVVGPAPSILWSMYADTADFGEWKFNRRSTGLVFSASVFSQKAGLAIGTGVVGWLLALCGFVANSSQGPRAIEGINLMFSVIPGVLGILGALAILFYPITEPLMKQIESDLALRKSGSSAPAA